MTCDLVRDRLLDRLDDLLEGPEAAAVDAHLGACPTCAAEAARLGRLRERLLTPWEVEAAPRLVMVRAAPGRRLLSHAVTFAAGLLLAAVLFRAEAGGSPRTGDDRAAPPPHVLPAAPPASPVVPPPPEFAFTSPRRIR